MCSLPAPLPQKKVREPPCSDSRIKFDPAVSRILSIQRVPDCAIISLMRLIPEVSIRAFRPCILRAGGPFLCYVLHHMGFFVPRSLRFGRWALTPPFHPYLPTSDRRFIFCDTVRRNRLSPILPVHSTRHAAIWCPDFPPRHDLRHT